MLACLSDLILSVIGIDAEECLDEVLRVEFLKVFDAFADSYHFDRKVQVVFEVKYDAAFGGSIKFGEDKSGETNGGIEICRLGDGILTGSGIEDEQRLMGGIRDQFFDRAVHFFQFCHQIVLGVLSAGRID